MSKKLLLCVLILTLIGSFTSLNATPIRQHPNNSHIFEYKGNPTVLITAAEHYSAVMNLGFNYDTYLNRLDDYKVNGKQALNLTRIFIFFRLHQDNPFGAPTINPRGTDNYICPFAWSDTYGSYDGKKLDLSRWNDAYFTRLKDFIQKAKDRDIIVELTLFSMFYSGTEFTINPFSSGASINGYAVNYNTYFSSTASPGLFNKQKEAVAKIVQETKQFDNVYYEICNEAQTPAESIRIAWQNAIAQVIKDNDNASAPHMIAINDKYMHNSDLSMFNIVNVHYPPLMDQVLNGIFDTTGRAIGYDETYWAETSVDSARVEAWEYLLRGSAVINNLQIYAYTLKNPAGNTTYVNGMRDDLTDLREFIEGFDYVKMVANRSVVNGSTVDGGRYAALVEEGKQYAIYIHHSTRNEFNFTVNSGYHTPTVQVNLPNGNYDAVWIDPATLSVKKSELNFSHNGGWKSLTAPGYSTDIALKITASDAIPPSKPTGFLIVE